MKREVIAVVAFVCCTLLSCWHHRGDTTITLSETKHRYSMEAWFHKDRTRDVEEYMDDKIGKESNVSFVNTRLDGRLKLDDNTTFFIKKSPGHIEIELDKEENSTRSYQQIKRMCEGIKEVLR